MTYILSNVLEAADSSAGAGQGGAGGGIMSTLLMFVPMILIFYFLILRPQKKQQKEQQNLIDSLKKGDHVQLNSGILGVVTKVDEKNSTFVIEIDKNTKTTIEVIKSAVVGKVNEEAKK